MHENLNHLPRKHEAQLWKSTTQCLSPIPHASDTVSILLRTPNVPVATLARSGSGMGCLLLHAVHQLRRFITVILIPTSFAAPSTLHSLHTPFYTRTMGQQAHWRPPLPTRLEVISLHTCPVVLCCSVAFRARINGANFCQHGPSIAHVIIMAWPT